MAKPKEPKPETFEPGPLKPADPDMLQLQPFAAVYRSPAEIIKDYSVQAAELMKVIEARPKNDQLIFNGKQYLVVEDWRTVGSFSRTWPRMVTTLAVREEQEPGRWIWGYESIFELYQPDTDRILSRAAARCMTDEPKWSSKPKYEWLCVCKDGSFQKDPPKHLIEWVPNPAKPGGFMPKKERRLVGDEAVPSFQLFSMAQTRAESKVLRVAFSHIVVLAGYGATPAEELLDMPEIKVDPVSSSSYEEGPPDEGYAADYVDPLKQKIARHPAAQAPELPAASTAKTTAKKKAAPEKKAAAPAPAAPPPAPETPPSVNSQNGALKITDRQRKRFFALAGEYGWSEPQIKAALKKVLKLDSTKDVLQGRLGYDQICDVLMKGPAAGGYGTGKGNGQ